MIPLSTHGIPHRLTHPIIGKVVSSAETSWRKRVLATNVLQEGLSANEFELVLCEEWVAPDRLAGIEVPLVHGLRLSHLAEGDVVGVDTSGYVRTLFRRASPHNTLFATDRCNSLCLMCSQPPRAVEDDWRVQEMLDVIGLMDSDTKQLGITGGEPTLLKDGFLTTVRAAKEQLPTTALHVLSNGRMFRYGAFAKALANIAHPDLMIGVPVYSDLDDQHDHVVQAKGAFEETMLGLQNLGRFGVPVEIRVVIHRWTYARLPRLAEFIYRNLTFASHVALMGLEPTGLAIPNLNELWIDPWAYRSQLEEATLFLAARGLNASVYNHQLCTVPTSIWPFCRKSISDWKNEFLPTCSSCGVRDACGGFFASSLQRRFSEHVHPVPVPLS